jgi:competence protein ComGE
MLSKNDGFFLLELLLSLSAWFMISLFFIPLLIELKSQSVQLELDKKVTHLLYEELQANLINNGVATNYSVTHNGLEYKINWRDTPGSSQKEVCVKVEENAIFAKSEKCATPE